MSSCRIQNVLRTISYEPGCVLSNLPLFIYNLIYFGDKIGATDGCLLQMICAYLCKYRPNLLETIDQRKNSLHAVMQNINLVISSSSRFGSSENCFKSCSLILPSFPSEGREAIGLQIKVVPTEADSISASENIFLSP